MSMGTGDPVNVRILERDYLIACPPEEREDLARAATLLEARLKKYPKTALIISHDRELLNNSVDAIVHIVDRKLELYTGGYDDFEKRRAEKLRLQSASRAKQEAERAHLQSFVDRFRAKASKATQAQSRLKRLAKLEAERTRVTGQADAARALLETERAEALRRLAALDEEFAGFVEASRDSNADDEHDPEGATIAYERSQVSALARQARAHLAEVDAALARVDAGTYGACERCGQSISPARLEARPAARLCVACASADLARCAASAALPVAFSNDSAAVFADRSTSARLATDR